MRQTLDDCRPGLLPLIVPIAPVRHQVRRLGVAHLVVQAHLDPHPRELLLRSHV